MRPKIQGPEFGPYLEKGRRMVEGTVVWGPMIDAPTVLFGSMMVDARYCDA